MTTSIGRALARCLAVGALAFILAACGGGGGDGSGGGGGGGGSSRGDFSLSTTSVSFQAKRNANTSTPPQFIALHLNDPSVAKVGAGYKPGVTPASWLLVTATGSGLDYVFQLTASTTAMANGTYTTTLTLGSSDASDNILTTRDVTVTFTVRDGLVIPNAIPESSAIAGSSDRQVRSYQFSVVAPANLQWTASSNAPWLQAPSGVQQGGGVFEAVGNVGSLPAGKTTARLTLVNTADSTDTATVDVIVNVTQATLNVSTQSPIVLGGASGLETAAVPLTFSLDTQANAHPWTVTPSTTSGGNWLHASAANGTVSGSTATVNLDAVGAQLPQGVYSGQVELRVSINGGVVMKTIPVTLNFEPNRLQVGGRGAAFSSFPGWQVLTRRLSVTSTRDGVVVPWTAVSDQAWLSATASGSAGDPLVLTANPTSLSAGQYFARVTVSSPDASVGNQEVIRVGLTVGSTNPPAMVTASPGVSARTVVTNPVEPEAFAAIGSSISVYNTYSGALLRTFSGSSNTILALTISDDGQKLYVLQNASAGRDILALNAATGAVEATYHIDSTFYDPGIQYIRPDTRPVLLSTVSADAFDLTTGTRYPQQVEGPGIAVSPDQRHIYTHNTGISASTIKSYLARFSTLNNLGLQITEVGNDFFDHINTSRGNGQDIALSADGTTLFSAAGAPYQFDVLEAATLRTTGAFPGDAYPNNVEVSWNGLVAAGSTSTSNPQGNIWVYNQTGTLLSRLSSGDDALAQRALRFSGDGTRIVSPATAGIRFQAAPNPPP